MPTPTTSRHTDGPGLVNLAGLSRHWRVAPATARAICIARGLKDTRLRPRPTFRWKDVWRIEGAFTVDPSLWDAFRQPLLTPENLGAFFPEVSARTIRRDLARGRWPVIALGDRIRRVRVLDVAEEIEARAGTRPVRRSGASDPEPAAIP